MIYIAGMVPVGTSPDYPVTIDCNFHSPASQPGKKKTGTASKERSRFFPCVKKAQRITALRRNTCLQNTDTCADTGALFPVSKQVS